VTLDFDGDWLSAEAGALLLREADTVFAVSRRLAGCFSDFRDPGRVEHDLEMLVRQRVMAIAQGHEDLNDHDLLRDDPLFALAVGREDITGSDRPRERDRGHPLAGSCTLNRLELGVPGEAETHRYRRIVADPQAIDRLMVDVFREAHGTPPDGIVLDLDATDDPLHGAQEGRHFHAYYDCYCHLPLYITCGNHVLCARLRSSKAQASEGALDEVIRIVARIRESWPQVRITVRGDSGFGRDGIMTWCDDNAVRYVFGIAGNARLHRQIERQMRKSRRRCVTTGRSSRRFRDFRYRPLRGWSRTRRVVGKAEVLPGPNGRNPRFIVTNIPASEFGVQKLYEELYCARGDMENRIKEMQLDLFADRTSAATMRANQLRLQFSVFAGILIRIVRLVGLVGTGLARAQPGTVRKALLKAPCEIRLSVRRTRVSLSRKWPHRRLFRQVAATLRRMAEGAAPLREAAGRPP